MSSVLVVAEHDNIVLKGGTLSSISAGLELTDTIDVLVVGADCQQVADSAAAVTGVAKVILADDPAHQHQPETQPETTTVRPEQGARFAPRGRRRHRCLLCRIHSERLAPPASRTLARPHLPKAQARHAIM